MDENKNFATWQECCFCRKFTTLQQKIVVVKAPHDFKGGNPKKSQGCN
jgi:hypothetical protein